MLEKADIFVTFFMCILWLFVCACVPTNQLRTIPFRTLIGSVVDNSGQAIKQATVTTDPPTSNVLTDDLGKFIITNLPEGIYTIQVAKHGFSMNSALIAIKGLGPFHADIQLTQRISTSPVEKEKLLPQIHSKEKEQKENSSWWPTRQGP